MIERPVIDRTKLLTALQAMGIPDPGTIKKAIISVEEVEVTRIALWNGKPFLDEDDHIVFNVEKYGVR